jgi:hypothetical protein
MPSLSSFISANQYTTESVTTPLLAGMLMGSTYNTGLTFNGVSGAASTDPGGLFGWLVYARNNFYSPAKGPTGDRYIVYTNPQEFVGDLNKLSGVTACLITAPNSGGTYGLFQTAGTVQNVVQLSALAPGKDFLFGIHYLAYGGTLIVAGSTTGLQQYITDSDNYFDVVIGQQATTGLCQWLVNQNYVLGIFPTIADSTGLTGAGITMANYANLFGSSSLVTGATVANRIFNVYGVKTVTDQDTSSLYANSKITYQLPAVSDVGGFFARTKNRNELYLSVAGLDRAVALNGNIDNAIDWNSALKTTLRTNRVNFFVNYDPKFLGSDVAGATLSTSAITSDERVGPAKLKSDLTKVVTQIGLKYLFAINNATTRAQVTAEVQTALDPFTPYIDTTQTQIVCDASNNTDNASALAIDVTIKPILSIDSFVVNILLTQ